MGKRKSPPPAPRPGVLFIHGDCCEVLRALVAVGVRVDSIIMDPAYESLERHRAKGTTTRLSQSKASSNKWFPTFPNARYWELFPLLYNVLLGDGYLHSWADVETTCAILTGRCPFHKPTDRALKEILVRHGADCCWEIEGQDWTAWPWFPWVKTKIAHDVDPLFDEVDLDYHLAQTGMGYHWRRCHEEVLVFEKGHRALKDPSLPGLLLGPRATKDDYPTAKPIEAYERIILNTTDPGDLVLDPFAGSGNCGIAALKHGRRAILIDVEHSGVYDTFRDAGLLHELLYLWGKPVDAAALDKMTNRIGA